MSSSLYTLYYITSMFVCTFGTSVNFFQFIRTRNVSITKMSGSLDFRAKMSISYCWTLQVIVGERYSNVWLIRISQWLRDICRYPKDFAAKLVMSTSIIDCHLLALTQYLRLYLLFMFAFFYIKQFGHIDLLTS